MTKTVKKTLALVLSVLMIMSVVPMGMVFAQSDDGYEYDRTNFEATITKYSGGETDVVIPEKLSVNTVIAIGDQAFYGNKTILTVTVPDTVTSVGVGAFMNCSSLKKVVLGKGVEIICGVAFRNCTALEEIVIGKNVTKIEKEAFKNCSDLTINYCGTKAQWETIATKEALGGLSNYVVNYNYGYNCEEEGAHILTEVAAKDETCEADGNIAYWSCDVCEKNFVYEGTDLKEVADVVVPGGHKLTKTDAKAPTCAEDGNPEYWTCSVCGKNFDKDGNELDSIVSEKTEEHSHSWNARVEPKCETAGKKGHYYCSVCDTYFDSKKEKVDESSLIIPATGHDTEKVEKVEKTCENNGNIEYWYCAACDKNFEDEDGVKELENVIIPASHEITFVEETKATCTSEGRKEHYSCTVCSKVFEDSKGKFEIDAEKTVIPMLPHDAYSEIFKDSTCTEKGNITYIGCYTCGKYFADKDFKVELNYKDDIEIDAKGHDWSSNFVDGKDGKHYNYCTREGCSVNNLESAADHIWDNGTVTTAPGCTEEGVRTFKCTVANCKATKTEAEPATGHTEGAPVKEHVVEMECDKDGSYDLVVYCAICETELSRTAKTVAHGHNIAITFPLEYKSQATCTEPAYIIEWCSRCEQNIDIPIGTALGHTEVTAPDRAPTCESDGCKGGTWCSVCKEYIVDPEILTATGHAWEKSETTATCTQAGTATYVCANDATHIQYEDDAALGHSFNDWVVTAEATCNKAGHETRVCTICLTPETREIPATNHPNKVHHLGEEATCVEKGTMEYWSCDDCGNMYSDKACTQKIESTITPVNPDNHNEETYTEQVDVVPGNCKTPETWTNLIRCVDCDEIVDSESVTGEKNPDIHTGNTYVEEEAVFSGTCIATEKWDVITYCADCDTEISRERVSGEVNKEAHVGILKKRIENEKAGNCKARAIWDEVIYCSACGEEDSRVSVVGDYNNEKHLGIKKTRIENEIAGTCKDVASWDKVVYCSGCENVIEVIAMTGEKDAYNHTNLIKTDAVDATCEEDGNIDYWTCEGCGKIYGDEDAMDEITAENTVIEAIGHSWGDWEYIEDGEHQRVCENDETHIRSGECFDSEDEEDCYCDLCGNMMGHSFTIADCTGPAFCVICGVATGEADPENHISQRYTEIEDVVEGTCTTKKTWNVVTYCAGCDEVLSTVAKTGEKNPDNHDWSDIIAPNNGADKVHYIECQRQGCNAKVDIDHNKGTVRVSKEPTCTEKGQQYYYCSYCKSYIYETIEAAGHADSNKDNKCDICGVLIKEPKPEDPKPEDPTPENPQPEDPSANCDCNCHKNGIMGFLFDFVLFFQRLFGMNRTCSCGVAHY